MWSQIRLKGTFSIILLISLGAINKVLSQNYSVVTYQKINETTGGFLGNLDNDDNWAISMDAIGDLDGNGVNDLAIGAYADDDGGYNRGAVWVLFLDANDMVIRHTKISSTSGNFTGTLDDDDRFGGAVAYLGDMNGDGLVELAVGADYDGDGGYWHGAVYILSLNSDGTVNSHAKISDTTGGFSGTINGDAIFGTDIENIGDLNNDGIDDLAVGSRREGDGGPRRGAVWILFMNADFTVDSHAKISATSGGFTGFLEYEDYFGGSVLNVGDLDGDGVTDLVVGTYRDDDGSVNAGSYYVLFLNPDGTVKFSRKVSNTSGGLTSQIPANSLFGESIDGVFDIDNDGRTEILVGALNHYNPSLSFQTGAFYIIELNTDGTVSEEHLYTYGENCFTGALDMGDLFGGSVTLLQTGINIKIAAGAYHDSDNGSGRGAVWILNLGDAISGSLAYQDPGTCLSNDGIIIISDLTPGFEYAISYSFNGNDTTITRFSDAGGIIQLTELYAGTYSNITTKAGSSGCSKNLGNLILNGTTLDVGLSVTDPTHCGRSDGSLLFSGLAPFSSYDISYLFKGTIESHNQVSDANGEARISALTAGTYGDLTVSGTNSDCTANIGDVVVIQPILNLNFERINPTSCSNKDGSLIISNAAPNSDYVIEFVYKESVFTLNLRSSSSGQITVNDLATGDYRDILVSDSQYSCLDGIELISLKPQTTSLILSVNNPSTCNTSDGSIHIEGLLPNQSYKLTYEKETKESNLTITSDFNGNSMVTGLASGYYSNISLISSPENCPQTIQPFELNCTIEFLGCFKTKNFFTPNNDGFNDSWHLETINSCDYSLFIYDKFGKLLRILTPGNPEWDGRYNGTLMPSSDYWYKVDYSDGTELHSFQSHFALKR